MTVFGGALRIAENRVAVIGHPVQHPRLAFPANAFAAGIGRLDAGGEQRIQDRLAVRDAKGCGRFCQFHFKAASSAGTSLGVNCSKCTLPGGRPAAAALKAASIPAGPQQ